MLESLGIVNIGMFVTGVIFIILAPGPNSLYVLATGMTRGIKAGYKAAAAVFVGDGVLMLLAVVGVDSFLRLYPVAFAALRYLGAAYLGYLGLRTLYSLVRAKGSVAETSGEERKEDPFRRALVLSLSNPKAILFFMSFFVQFVDPTKGHTGVAFLVLASIVQVVSLTYLSFLIIGGSHLAAVVRGNMTLQRLGTALMGCVFLAFGCRLALKATE